jgi:hypothetical protein
MGEGEHSREDWPVDFNSSTAEIGTGLADFYARQLLYPTVRSSSVQVHTYRPVEISSYTL